jgi:hypothetical protein
MRARLVSIAIPLIVLGISGCSGSVDKGSAYKAQLDGYMACNLSASKVVSTQAGDPMALAIAARGLCGKEELALMQAVQGSHSPTAANRIIEMFRTRMVEENVTSIVTLRARRG